MSELPQARKRPARHQLSQGIFLGVLTRSGVEPRYIGHCVVCGTDDPMMAYAEPADLPFQAGVVWHLKFYCDRCMERTITTVQSDQEQTQP